MLVTNFETIVDPVNDILIFLRLLLQDKSTFVQVFHEVIIIILNILQLLIHLSNVIWHYALSILVPLDHFTVLQLVQTVGRYDQHWDSILDAFKHAIVPTMIEEDFSFIVFE